MSTTTSPARMNVTDVLAIFGGEDKDVIKSIKARTREGEKDFNAGLAATKSNINWIVRRDDGRLEKREKSALKKLERLKNIFDSIQHQELMASANNGVVHPSMYTGLIDAYKAMVKVDEMGIQPIVVKISTTENNRQRDLSRTSDKAIKSIINRWYKPMTAIYTMCVEIERFLSHRGLIELNEAESVASLPIPKNKMKAIETTTAEVVS